jgi:hypothetical protein
MPPLAYALRAPNDGRHDARRPCIWYVPLYLLLRLDARLALGGALPRCSLSCILSSLPPCLALFTGNETDFPEVTGRARGVRWSGDEVCPFVLFTVCFLRRGGYESAPVDSSAASREQGPRCASRAGRWEKRDVMNELLSPSLPFFPLFCCRSALGSYSATKSSFSSSPLP